MRIVEVFEFQNPGKLDVPWPKVTIGLAHFHQWGVDFEEFEYGPGNFSTAIVEFEDGTVKNVPAEMVKFLKGNSQ